jgi:hypothetical protein
MHTSILASVRKQHLVPVVLAVSVLLFASVTLANIISGSSSVNSSTQVTVTRLTLGAPTSTAVNDVLLANISINKGNAAVVTSVPSGWHQISETDNDANVSIISYWKHADSSDINASYEWDIDKQTQAEGGITAYSGVDTNNPIDVIATSTDFTTTATAPSVTTTADNEEVVSLFATDFGKNANVKYFGPTGLSEKYNSPNAPYGPSIAAFDTTQATAGASGSVSSAINSNKPHNWVAQQIALRRPPPGHISVETGTNGPASTLDCGTVSSITLSKTVSATSTLLIVHVVPGGYATSATYAGVAMTLATTTPGTDTWYLANPTSGTNDVVVNYSRGLGTLVSAVSYTGTDTSSPLGAIATNTGRSGDASVTISTTHDNSIIDDGLYYDYGQSLTANSPQVQQIATQCPSGANESHGASTLTTTTHGSNTLGWTHGGTSSDWWEVAVEVNPAP